MFENKYHGMELFRFFANFGDENIVAEHHDVLINRVNVKKLKN